MADSERDILVITADAVKQTGEVSYSFMIEADPGWKLKMPNLFGLVRNSDPRKIEPSFNVFEGGKGLVAGGGWSGDDFECHQKMFDAIPSCTLLMDIDLFPWWEEMARKHGVEFRHHHHPGILRTS
jgi:hypothetical protein